MPFADEFIKYCTQTLEVNFGQRSNAIINKVLSKKNLHETSNVTDFKEFIDLIEHEISALSGKNKAMNTCNVLKNKAIELNISRQAMDICNALRAEPFELNINMVSGKDNTLDISAHITRPSFGQKYRSIAFGFTDKLFKKSRSTINLQDNSVPKSTRPLELPVKQKSSELYMSDKIDEFLMKNILPSESEITRYATFLTLKQGGDAKKVKKDIIEKARVHVKNEISKKAIRKEINNFLTRYPQPVQTDIDEFVNYINLLKLNIHNHDEIRQLIEKERLSRKFSESHAREETSKLDPFINIIKNNDDKEDIIEAMQKKDLSFLIKDESGISDRLLDEFVALMRPIEKKGIPEKPGHKRKIKKAHSRE